MTNNPFLHAGSEIRSLNRVRLVTLPGVPVDEAALNKTAYEVLSAAALKRQLASLVEPVPLLPADIIRQADDHFDHPDRAPLLTEAAATYGRRLGYLLLLLKRAGEANREARPEWQDAHWAVWQRLRQVYVGGGLVAGRFGRHAVQAARHFLQEHASGLALHHARHAAHLPLLGLARSAPAGATHMLLLDFGHTAVKRAFASYEAMALRRLEVLAPLPSPCGNLPPGSETVEAIRQRWQAMLETILASWAECPAAREATTALGVSLACYLPGGQPTPSDRGCYGRLQTLGPHLTTFIRDEIGRCLRPSPVTVVMHDGSAAAAAYAGEAHTLVLTLGTAIGSGFPPLDGGSRAVHGAFQLWDGAGARQTGQTDA